MLIFYSGARRMGAAATQVLYGPKPLAAMLTYFDYLTLNQDTEARRILRAKHHQQETQYDTCQQRGIP